MSFALADHIDVLEISSWASRTTLDIIGVAGMGQDFNCLSDPNNELKGIYGRIFAASRGARLAQMLALFLPSWLIRRVLFTWNREIEDSATSVKRICSQLIATKREKLEKGNSTDVDILSVALNSGGFSDENVVNQYAPAR